MSDSYVMIERRHGEVTVTRYEAGHREILAAPPRRKKAGAADGYWQQSKSNGFAGTEATKRKAMAVDAKLGVSIDYKPISSRGGKSAYVACFKSAREKNNWLRAHKRVDFDASYSAPAPGTFRGYVPQEPE